jgi:hypothetical protein
MSNILGWLSRNLAIVDKNTSTANKHRCVVRQGLEMTDVRKHL